MSDQCCLKNEFDCQFTNQVNMKLLIDLLFNRPFLLMVEAAAPEKTSDLRLVNFNPSQLGIGSSAPARAGLELTTSVLTGDYSSRIK